MHHIYIYIYERYSYYVCFSLQTRRQGSSLEAPVPAGARYYIDVQPKRALTNIESANAAKPSLI